MSRNLAIVPAYNEAGAIATTIAALRQWASDFDVVVIDDGSSDATAAHARAAGATVLRMPFNLGIGGAMQSGYIYAREHGYDVAVQVDGDGQHDPRHIHSLLTRLREDPELNMVTGSRFLDAAGEGYRSSTARRIGIRVFSTVVSRITGQRVTDPTSGFRMTDRRGIELFARDYPHDYPEVEAILLMHAHRLKSCEIPVVMRPRLTGRSAISSTQSVYYMVKVLLAVFVALFRARPSSNAVEAVETVETAKAVEAGEDAAAAAAAGPAGAARVSEGAGATGRGRGGELAEAPDAVAEGPDAVAAAPDAVAEGPDGVAEAPDAVAEGPDGVAEAPDAVAEGGR